MSWTIVIVTCFPTFAFSINIGIGILVYLAVSLIQIVLLAIMYYRVRKVFKARVNNSVVEDLLSSSVKENDVVVATRLEENKRAVSTITLIFIMQILVFVTINCQNFIAYFDKSAFNKEAFLINYIFGPLNGIYNPLVCMLRMTDFKDSIKAMFSRQKTRETGT